MSARIFVEDVLFLQRFAHITGVYDGPLDSVWNQTLDDAEERLAAE